MYKKIIIIIVFFLIGCSNFKKDIITDDSIKQKDIYNKEKKSLNYKKQNKDKISMSMRIPKTLNPILNEDPTVDNVLRLVFEHLFVLDENLKPIPNLASNIEFSEDSKSAILYIKKDILWEDGNKLTAEDVIFTLNAIKNYKKGMYKDTIDSILNYEIIDTYKLKVNFKNSVGGQAYSFCFPILPKHYYKDFSDINSYKNFKILGNGAFKLISYRPVKEIDLIYNQNYFKEKPDIKNINVIMTPDYDTDIYAFEQEIIDILLCSLVDWSKHNSFRDISFLDICTNYFDFIGFNFNNSILKNKKIREAISYATNKEEIIKKAYLNKAVITNSPINPKSWIYEENTKKYEYSMEKAKEILKKEGYEFNETLKCLQKNINGSFTNIKFKIIVNEENIERLRIANILKDSLQNMGIIVELMILDYDTYLKMLKDKDFDIFIGGFKFSPNPKMDFAFHSSQILGGQNFFSYSNEELDNILFCIKNSENENIYLKNLSNFQKHIAENLPLISISFRENILLIDKKIKCDINLSINNIYNNINKLFIVNKQKKN